MDKCKKILCYFPQRIRNVLNMLSPLQWKTLNEISIINGQPLNVVISGKRQFMGADGATVNSDDAYLINKEDVSAIFELITKSSVYAFSRFISDGFLTLPGGHRVGISGNYIYTGDRITNLTSVNSFSFRISHDIMPDMDIVFDEICSNGYPCNTVIISPPGSGKTTFLRCLAFELSSGKKNRNIIKCAVIDERFEIAACENGLSTMNVGLVTSVISGCPKNIAIPMMVRSMAPDVILTDELASGEDVSAIKYARASGCKVIATTHGINETSNELSFFNIQKLFDKIIILSSRNGPGTVEKILAVN